jgi:hypothetical protein
VQMCVSIATLSGWSSSVMVGLRSPILVLKSPHITVVNCACMRSSVVVMWSVAICSGMLRFFRDAVGGKYIFTILIR